MVLLKSNILYITRRYIIIRHPSLSTRSFSSFVGCDVINLILLTLFNFLPGTNLILERRSPMLPVLWATSDRDILGLAANQR